MTDQLPEALVKQISRLCRDDHMKPVGNALVGISKTSPGTLVVLEHRPNDHDDLPYHVTQLHSGDIIERARFGSRIAANGSIPVAEVTVYDNAKTHIQPLTVQYDGSGNPKRASFDFTATPRNLAPAIQSEAGRRINFASCKNPDYVTTGNTITRLDFPLLFATARKAAESYIAELPENQRQLFLKPPQHSTGRRP